MRGLEAGIPSLEGWNISNLPDSRSVTFWGLAESLGHLPTAPYLELQFLAGLFTSICHTIS